MPTDETSTDRVTIKVEALASGFCMDDRYEIVQKLGEGFMSVVYRARHLQLNRDVALKILHQHLADDPEAIQRFQQEAAAISALEHPNIVKVYGSGIWQSCPYISTELVDGISLANMIEVDKHLPKEQAVPIFLQILDGLGHAHRRGIIHRDIRPSNIMLTDGMKTVKIIDFGIAKVLPESGKHFQTLTQTGQLFGTLMYMSPERCMGHPATVKSDLYSMGCLMYETLAGTPPAQGATDAALIDQQVKQTPKRHPVLNDDLGNVIFWCLAKDPERRPESAAELKSAVLQPAKFRFANSGRRQHVRLALVVASIALVAAATIMLRTSPVVPQAEPLGKEEIEACFDRTHKLFDEHKYAETESVYKELIEKLALCAKRDNRLAVIEPLLHARVSLGTVFLAEDKYADAQAQAEQTVDSFNKYPSLSQSSELGTAYCDALRLMGDLATRQGKLHQAVLYGEANVRYVRSAPLGVRRWAEAPALQWLAESYLNEGEVTKAISGAKATIEYAGDHHGAANGDWVWPEKRAQICLVKAYLTQAAADGDQGSRNRDERDAIEAIEQFAPQDVDFDYGSLNSDVQQMTKLALRVSAIQTDAGQGKQAVKLLSSIDEMQNRTKLLSEHDTVQEALAKARAAK